jgi:hypothetical protein
MQAGAVKDGAVTQKSIQHFHPNEVFQEHCSSEALCNIMQNLVETVVMKPV